MKKLELSVLLGLILSLVITSFSQINLTASNIREETLRLHIIANSNSDIDQETKILIRDEVLVLAGNILSSSSDIESAKEDILDNITFIEDEVNAFLEKKDIDYKAFVSLENFYFDTTSYENFTLPKGEYPALTVNLGEGSGNNWWCVVYPTLCVLPSCEISLESNGSEYTDDKINTFIKNDDIEIKFKTVEVFEDIKNFILDEKIEVYDKTS